MEDIFKKADISEGSNVDGELDTYLCSTDYVIVLTNKRNKWGKTFEHTKLGKSESWLRNTHGKDKIYDKPSRQWRYLNWAGGKMKEWQNSNISDKQHASKGPQKKKKCQEQGTWNGLGKTKTCYRANKSLYHSKTNNGPTCLTNNDLWLPYIIVS